MKSKWLTILDIHHIVVICYIVVIWIIYFDVSKGRLIID